MKLAYKLLYVINTLFTLYLFANNLLFYTTTPDKIFIFALIYKWNKNKNYFFPIFSSLIL